MATKKEKWQEIANRGLEDNFDGATRAKFDEAVSRGLIIMPENTEENMPLEQTGFLEASGETLATIGQNLATVAGAGIKGLATGAFNQSAETGLLKKLGIDPLDQTASQAVEEFRASHAVEAPSERSQAQMQDIGGAVEFGMDKARIPLSGLAGLGELAAGQGIEQASQTIQSVQDRGLGKTGGDRVFEETGSPLAATSAFIAPDIVANALGFGGVSKVAGKAVVNPPRVSEGIKSIFRGGEEGRKAVNSTVEAFEVATGQTPTLGQATGRQTLQALESVVGKFVGGKPLRNQLDKVAEGAAQKVKSIADDISTTKGSEAAGRVIGRGITGSDGFVQRFQGKSGVLWNKVDDLIPEDMTVDLSNTKKVLDDAVRGDEFGRVLNDPKLVQIREVLNKTTKEKIGQVGVTTSRIVEKPIDIDYNTLKSLRSHIGRKLSSNDLLSDIPRADLKRIYGALSDDIKLASEAASPDALKAFNRANKFTKAGHTRLDDFVERVAKKVDFDKIFNSVTKGGEGSQVINAFKRSLKPGEWDVVVSNVVRRLGKNTAGRQDAFGESFSLDKFLTDYNKLGSAKKALFSGTKKTNSYAQDLEDIAKVAQRAKESSKELAGQSGTAQLVSATSVVTGVPIALLSGSTPIAASLVGLVAVNRGAAHLMSSPRFVKWLAKSSSKTEIDMGRRIAELGVVAANADDAEARAISEYIDSMQEIIAE